MLANLFLIGMALIAALMLFAAVSALRYFGVSAELERTIVGCTAVAVIFATGLIARASLRRIERRR